LTVCAGGNEGLRTLWEWAAQNISEWATQRGLRVGNNGRPRRDGKDVSAALDVSRAKLFHRTVACAREMIAWTFLVAINQGWE
jgi:hypothetical protein